MPKSANQKQRILFLLRLLLERTDEQHPMTVREMIGELERQGLCAERKAIYDDLEALRLFGLDIETRDGRGGAYYVASRTFELPELKLLVDAVQASKFITHKKSNQLIGKVESLASVHEAKQLQRQVYVSNRVKTVNETIYYGVDRIHAAISQGSKISFLYFAWKLCFGEAQKVQKEFRHESQRYVVSPWALIWDDENYYLVGYDAQAERIKHYRVDKMEDIQITGEAREGQAHFQRFDPAVYANRLFGMFGGREEQVLLRFDEALVGVVVDRFGREASIRRSREGCFELSVRVEVSPQFFSWLFGFGRQVEILKPAAVRQEFLEQLRAVKELYQEGE